MSLNKKKICVINNLYYPYSGGAAVAAENWVKILQNSNCEVFIITTDNKNEELIGKNQEKIYRLRSLFPKLNKINLAFRLVWHFLDAFDIINYFKIRKILKKEKPEVVITHNLKGITFLLPKLLKKLKIKHIHVLHDVQLIYPSGLVFFGHESVLKSLPAQIYQYICKILFNSPNIIISPSKWLMLEHEKLGFFKKSEKVVLPFPVTPRLLTQEINNNKIFNFVFVGVVEKSKGIDFLCETFYLWLAEREANNKKLANLKIIGSGSLLAELKNKFSDNNFKFFGQLEHNQAIQEMLNSDCLVLPSLCYENSPTVLTEAVSCGEPFIASAIGGIPEISEKYHGNIFTPGNRDELLDLLSRAVDDQKELKKISADILTQNKFFTQAEYVKKIEEMV